MTLTSRRPLVALGHRAKAFWPPSFKSPLPPVPLPSNSFLALRGGQILRRTVLISLPARVYVSRLSDEPVARTIRKLFLARRA